MSQLFFLSDDLFHDLRRSRPNRIQTQIAPHTPDRILRRVGEPAEDLHAIVRDLLRQLRSVELGHGDLADGTLAAIQQVERAIDHPAPRFDRGEVLGETVAPDLEFADLRTEGSALV